MSRARDTANFDPSLLADDEVSLDKLGTSGTLDVSSGTLTTSTAQKEAIVQAGPGSGTLNVSSGTFTTSTAQKEAIVQAGPGSGTLDVSSGTFTTSTAQKQAIVDGADVEGTAILSTGESGGSKFLREDGDNSCSWQTVVSVPTGMIAPFGTSNVPTGWLACDGATVSRSTYSDLFSAIGTTWGSGDGSSTFHVPDLEGAFLRGAGSHNTHTMAGGGAFAGPSVGGFENDSFQDHEHTQTGQYGNAGPYANGTYPGTPATTNVVAGGEGTPRNSDGETKPFNAGVKFCIKT